MTPLRLAPKAREWLDGLARRHHVPRAVVIRAALTVARRHESELTKIIEEQS